MKSTDKLRYVDDGNSIACTVELAHVRYWLWELVHPFVLVLYDAHKHRAFWIDMDAYLEDAEIEDGQTMTVRIPVGNTLTVRAIDRFRKLSLTRQERLRQGRQ